MGVFARDVTADENGMQKLINFVNDANNKIAKKGGQTVDLVPLERTAPVAEETAVTETTTEAAPVAEEIEVKPKSFRDAVFKGLLEDDIRKAKSEIQLAKKQIEDRKSFIQRMKDNLQEIKEDKDLSAEDKKDYEARMEEQIKELPSFISKRKKQ